MKKEVIVATAHIIELGKATNLTLGGSSDSLENWRPAPWKWIYKNNVELGKATNLTMGNGIGGYEGPGSQIRKVKNR